MADHHCGPDVGKPPPSADTPATYVSQIRRRRRAFEDYTDTLRNLLGEKP